MIEPLITTAICAFIIGIVMGAVLFFFKKTFYAIWLFCVVYVLIRMVFLGTADYVSDLNWGFGNFVVGIIFSNLGLFTSFQTFHQIAEAFNGCN